MRIALVLPGFNEESKIETSLLNVREGIDLFPEHDFMLFPVDDNSQDRTFEAINDWGRKYGLPMNPHRNSENLGLVQTLKDAYSRVFQEKIEFDYTLKTDLDDDPNQRIVLETMIPFISGNEDPNLRIDFSESEGLADIAIGMRWRDITREDNEYEFIRREDIFRLFSKYGLKKLDPPSAPSQLYKVPVAKRILESDVARDYDKRWGLDVLVPLVGKSLGYVVRLAKLKVGPYNPDTRPEKKVRDQYDSYIEIIGKLQNKNPEELSKLYGK